MLVAECSFSVADAATEFRSRFFAETLTVERSDNSHEKKQGCIQSAALRFFPQNMVCGLNCCNYTCSQMPLISSQANLIFK